jgi:hypothetical protein
MMKWEENEGVDGNMNGKWKAKSWEKEGWGAPFCEESYHLKTSFVVLLL